MKSQLTKCVRRGLLAGSLLFACLSGRLALASDRYESDNTVGTASNIAVGASQTNRTIHVVDDIDYVSFNAVVKHAYGAGMTNIVLEIPGLGPGPGVLTLYDTNGTTVITTGSSETEIWVRMLAATAGTYYARAESSEAASTGSYDLVLSDYGTGDGYEMDNSPGTASNFVVGVSQPRSLHWNGDTDYARFTNTANHLYLFKVTNYTDMISITLYNTNGTDALASDDSFGDASFEYLLVSTGTYYVSVSPAGGSTATYDLAISDLGELLGDAYEPDNSVATASNITVGVIQTNRSIHWSGDLDYVAVAVTSAHRYVITATNVGTNLDIAVSLYGTNGTTLLGSVDSGASGESEFLTNVCTITGTNFIKLAPASGTGAYSLVVTDIGTVPLDSNEVDNSIGQAALITPGAPQANRTIHLTSDVDYLQFTAAQAERYYTIETYNLDWGLDTYIYLYDSTGTNLLASDNDSGYGPASWLEYKTQAAGTYYIKVSANNAASVGYYSIRLTDTRVREKSWKTRSSLGALSSPAIGNDGLIYVGSYDSNMYAFAPGGTTSKVWHCGSYIASSPAIASNGSVYIGSHDDFFYCFNTNGITNWISTTTFGDIVGAPALSFEGRVYIGSAGFRFLSFNPNGTTNWTIALPGQARVSPAIGTNGTVYIGCDATNFYSFSPNNVTNWLARASSVYRSSAAIDSNGVIYVASFGGNLYAFNPTNGATNHIWATGKFIGDSSPVIGTNGDIYIGAYQGTTTGMFYSFKPDGTTNWAIQFTNTINSTPLIGYDGTIYIGTEGGYFYAFNPDGTTNFMTTLTDDITSSPVIDTNGLLYVTADNRMFAIYGTSYGIGGLGESPWPMFLHDARHTGALPPPAPPGIAASDGSFTNQVQITWNATTNTASYDIYRSTTNNSATAVRIATAVSNQHNDTSAVPATACYYWVKAVNHSGNSPFSMSDTGWRMIAPPAGVTASDGTSTSMVQVAWNSVSGAASYLAFRNTTNDALSASNLTEVAGTNYSDTTTVANITYYYFVRARGANGTNSAFSLPDTGWRAAPVIVIGGTPPSAPIGLAASDGAWTDKVRLNWTAVTNADGYSVFRSTSSSTSAASAIGSSTTTNYDDTSATTGQLFYYWVKATNAYGASAVSSSDSGWRSSLTVTVLTVGACADYDGDRFADPAVYDQATGLWKIRLSSDGYLIVTTLNGFGGEGYASVAADYDGDHKADPAVYQETTGIWIILPSSLDYAAHQLGQTLGGPGYSGMPADYDSDQKADPGVYQRELGNWKALLSLFNYYAVNSFGLLGGTGYRAVAADYDGDRLADPAVYGEATGDWQIKLSSAGYWKYDSFVYGWTLGGAGYVPVPADYDGDGFADPAVRSETGNEWIVMLSLGGYTPTLITILFE